MRPSEKHQVHECEPGKYHWCVEGTHIEDVKKVDSITGEELIKKVSKPCCLDIVEIPKRVFCEHDVTGKILSLHHVNFSYALECEGHEHPVELKDNCHCLELFELPEHKDLSEIIDNYEVDINTHQLKKR